MKIMTPKHPRWNEFCNRLFGSEGCNFKKDPKKGFTWKCKGGENKDFAKEILKKMGDIDIPKTFKFFEKEGAFCDCEIIFNIDK